MRRIRLRKRLKRLRNRSCGIRLTSVLTPDRRIEARRKSGIDPRPKNEPEPGTEGVPVITSAYPTSRQIVYSYVGEGEVIQAGWALRSFFEFTLSIFGKNSKGIPIRSRSNHGHLHRSPHNHIRPALHRRSRLVFPPISPTETSTSATAKQAAGNPHSTTRLVAWNEPMTTSTRWPRLTASVGFEKAIQYVMPAFGVLSWRSFPTFSI